MMNTKRADQYNDPKYNYQNYWQGREYEHKAELIAIRKLLKGKHFKLAVDIGGGYGRLTVELTNFADKVVLAEPSQQQLDMAKKFLKGHINIERRLMQADKLKFDSGSVDLATMVRVLHHINDPSNEFSEISRILSPNGYAILEVANYMHVRNRLRHFIKGKKMPTKPVDIRSKDHREKDDITFVNHNPYTVIKQLDHAGLKVERILSVSNLRSPSLKKIIPTSALIAVEGILQPVLAKTFFGPSVFFLIKKQ